ncbi:hypothetical protein Syun_017330 [Stephania yunnanensis]|uniref:Uncharacterized protein n=1 Tax=Stephania yunnanensis TaxID=152371 RepID=A0AAP0J6U5_9MAGN
MPTVQASAAASAGRRPHQPRRLPPTSRIVAAPLLAGPAAAPRRSFLSHRRPSLSAISLSLSLSLAAVGSLFRPDPVARPDLAERGDRIRRRVCWPSSAPAASSSTAEPRRRRATPGRTCRCAGDHGSGGGHHI